jgi:hypothetical protein
VRVCHHQTNRHDKLFICSPFPANQCWGSVTFCCGSGSFGFVPLTNRSGSGPPPPDPTPFFSSVNLRMQKRFFSSYFFLITYPQAQYLQSYTIFAKLLCLNFILQALFKSAQHLYEKKEGSGSGFIPMTNGSGSGRPKNMRILRSWFLIRIPKTAANTRKIEEKTRKKIRLIHNLILSYSSAA